MNGHLVGIRGALTAGLLLAAVVFTACGGGGSPSSNVPGNTAPPTPAPPVPDGFYSGDTMQVPGVGLVRDYYSFEWGDALFVVIDPYWHSPVPVVNGVPGVEKTKDAWEATIGDEQYAWFKSTLEKSRAKYKFVFEHHVLGTGRGAAALVHTYEWAATTAMAPPMSSRPCVATGPNRSTG